MKTYMQSQKKQTEIFLTRTRLVRKNYALKATIESMQKSRVKRYYSESENDLYMIEKISKKSNIRFELFPCMIEDSEVKNYISNKPLSEYAQHYLMQCSQIMACIALKGVYANSCNPHVYKIYTDVCRIISEDCFDTFSGKRLFYISEEEKADKAFLEEFKTAEECNLPIDCNGNDIITACYDCLIALYRMNMLFNFSDVWQYSTTVYSFVNRQIAKERRSGKAESFDSLANVSKEEAKDIVSLWKDVRKTLSSILVRSSKMIDSDRAEELLTIYELHKIFGFTQEQIAEKMNCSRVNIVRRIAVVDSYIQNFEVMEEVKNAI